MEQGNCDDCDNVYRDCHTALLRFVSVQCNIRTERVRQHVSNVTADGEARDIGVTANVKTTDIYTCNCYVTDNVNTLLTGDADLRF